MQVAATSASRLMKRLAVKEVTRHVSDQELDTMIRAALPKDRKEFLHQCMRFRKHSVLDAVFGAVIELDGEGVASRVLQGARTDERRRRHDAPAGLAQRKLDLLLMDPCVLSWRHHCLHLRVALALLNHSTCKLCSQSPGRLNR